MFIALIAVALAQNVFDNGLQDNWKLAELKQGESDAQWRKRR